MTTADHDGDSRRRAELWRQLATEATPVGPDATIAAVVQRLDRRQAHRRVASWASVAVVALVTGTTAIIQGSGQSTLVADAPPPVSAPGSSTGSPDSEPITGQAATADAPDPSGLRRSPLAPLGIRAQAALAWTGTEVVVWGGHLEAENWGLPGSGQTYYSDGAAYDPASNSWRPLAPSPLPDATATPHAITVEGGVLVVRDRSAAIWDPTTDTWRALPDAPGPIDDLAGAGVFAVSYSARAMLDVPKGEWRRLPEPPTVLSRATSMWTGSRLVVVGDRGPTGTSPVSNAGALVLDPSAGTWQELGDPPVAGAEALAASFDGRRVVVVNYDGTAAALDPETGAWKALPRLPFRFYENAPRAAASTSGLTIVEAAGTVAVLDGELWTPLPIDALTDGSGLADMVAADVLPDGVWVWNVDASGVWLTAAEPLAFFAQTSRLQVGVATVTLPPRMQLISAGADSNGDRVRVEAAAPGGTCELISTYDSPYTTVEPVGADWVSAQTVDDPGFDWLSSPDGTGWRTLVSDTDTFDVRCPDATDAAALVKSVRFAYHQGRDG